MFCKHCGKEINDDSTFCKYCGKKVTEDSIEHNKTVDESVSTSSDQDLDSIQTDVEDDNQNTLIKEQRSEKGNSTADEVVAIFKMIGFAIICCLVYLVGFYLFHQKDIKEFKFGSDYTYFGESCYDPPQITGGGSLSAQAIYERNLYYKKHPNQQYIDFSLLGNYPENSQSIEVVPEEYKDDPLYIAAVEEANKNKQELIENLNFYRFDGFREDLKKNAMWSLIISLCFFVIGRYIIKSFKWVNENRTKD